MVISDTMHAWIFELQKVFFLNLHMFFFLLYLMHQYILFIHSYTTCFEFDIYCNTVKRWELENWSQGWGGEERSLEISVRDELGFDILDAVSWIWGGHVGCLEGSDILR